MKPTHTHGLREPPAGRDKPRTIGAIGRVTVNCASGNTNNTLLVSRFTVNGPRLLPPRPPTNPHSLPFSFLGHVVVALSSCQPRVPFPTDIAQSNALAGTSDCRAGLGERRYPRRLSLRCTPQSWRILGVADHANRLCHTASKSHTLLSPGPIRYRQLRKTPRLGPQIHAPV